MKSTALLIFFLTVFAGEIYAGDDPAANKTRLVSGKVLSPDGETLPGASITIKETGETVFADLDGHFQLQVPSGKSYTIHISSIGFQPKKLKSNTIFHFSEQVLSPLPQAASDFQSTTSCQK